MIRRWVGLGICGAALVVMSAQLEAATTLDPDLQKVYNEAVKVIPKLSAEVLAGAKQEGQLTYYRQTWEIEQLYPEFNRLFPFIKISDYKGTGGTILQKYTSEVRAGRFIADVSQSSEPSMVADLDKEGLVTHYEPSTADTIPAQFVMKGVYYPITMVFLGTAYNSDLVSEKDAEILQTWNGMLDPRFKGKTGVIQFGVGGTSMLMYYFAAHGNGPDFWQKMFAQQPMILSAAGTAAERLAAGGYSVCFFGFEGSFYDLQKKGAPLRWKVPEPALAYTPVQFIAKNPPHPNAAKLWQDFVLSKTGQSLLMKKVGQMTVRGDMGDERPFAKEPWYKLPKSYYKYDWATLYKDKDNLREMWDRSTTSLKKAQ